MTCHKEYPRFLFYYICKQFNPLVGRIGCPEFSWSSLSISLCFWAICPSATLFCFLCLLMLTVSSNAWKVLGHDGGAGGRNWFSLWFYIPSFNITVMLGTWSSYTAMASPTSCCAQHVFCKGKLSDRWIWSITKLDIFKLYVFWVCSYIFYLSHANIEL